MRWVADVAAPSGGWEFIAPVAQAIVAISVLIGLYGLRRNRKLRLIGYEDHFEQRYWELMQQLSPRAVQEGIRSDDIGVTDEKVARAYFLHCEAELNARAAGHITDQTWEVWKKGIGVHMRQHPFSDAWDVVQNEKTAERLPKLAAFMNYAVTDPCELGSLRRWFSCLTGGNRR
ncbi:hypothetical protein [Streptomyces sp. EMB26]